MQPENPPLSKDHELDIALGIILSIITCGFYNIYWNYREFQALNALLGREEYRFWYWLLLSIVTCGIFHIYYEYKMGSDLYEHLTEHGITVNPNLPVIGLILSIFGLTIIADAVYQ
ncbi:MAG: DUF4234 domain-containing protein, partial [Elusimicrobiota bacterium]